jgi:hypothetical protein
MNTALLLQRDMTPEKSRSRLPSPAVPAVDAKLSDFRYLFTVTSLYDSLKSMADEQGKLSLGAFIQISDKVLSSASYLPLRAPVSNSLNLLGTPVGGHVHEDLPGGERAGEGKDPAGAIQRLTQRLSDLLVSMNIISTNCPN